MVNPKLFFYIRQELSDLPEDLVSDEVILRSILKAENFLNTVLRSTVSSSDKEQCLISLAAYYTYIDYTAVVTRGLGSTPEYSEERAERLKQIALTFIRLHSDYVVNDDLTVEFPDGLAPVVYDTVGCLDKP